MKESTVQGKGSEEQARAGVRIREAAEDDCAALSWLLDQLGHPAGADAIRERLWQMRSPPGQATDRALVAVVDGEVRGLVTTHVTPVLHRVGPVGRITSLIVDAFVRGRGVGKALVAEAEHLLADLGCSRVEITSGRHRSEAHRFYQNLGYRDEGVRFAKALPNVSSAARNQRAVRPTSAAVPRSAAKPEEHHRSEFTVSDDPERLDVRAIHAYLTRSYWAAGIPEEVVRRSVTGSLCFGLYEGERQVGFARAITDRATFAYLADVYVLEEFRGRGLGRWLIECVMAHSALQGLRRMMLVTRDAHWLYRPFGFAEPDDSSRYMEIRRSNVYAAER